MGENEIFENGPVKAEERVVREYSNTKYNKTLVISITAILTALETVATMMITVPIPGSNGYFNIGESIIYFAAILFGPAVGAFVGGVGAAFADIFLGYAFFAPGTLVVKALEGFLVGKLYRFLESKNALRDHWKTLSVVMGIIASVIIIGVGIYIPEIDRNTAIILAVIVLLLILGLGMTLRPQTGIRTVSILVGGSWMVLGYFLYISFILDLIKPNFYLEWNEASAITAALWEVPWDIMQVLISLLIAVPVIAAVEPLLKKGNV